MALRLGVRLLRGGGRPGLIRVGLLVLGIGLGVTAVLYALAIPAFSSASGSKAAARLPSPTTGVHAFRYAVTEDSANGRRWMHVLIADPAPNVVPPPGLERLPGLGEIIASPAAAREIVRGGTHERLSNLRVGATGLRDPDELIDYTRVTAEDLPAGGLPGASFGEPAARAASNDVPETTLLLEIALLVGVPAALYLATVTQLSTATRVRRLAALRLVGADEQLLARAHAVESALGGAAGALVGLALYHVTLPLLAGSGVLGFRWFASDTRFGWVGSTATALAVTLACARLGTLGTRRRARSLLAVRAEPDADAGSPLRLLPLVLGLGLLLPAVTLSAFSGHRRASGTSTALLLAGVLLSVIGLVTSIRPLTGFVARRLVTARALPLRLAARRLLFEPSSAARVTTGLVLLVVIAGLGSALLHDAELAAGPRGTSRLASIDGGSITTAPARQQALDLPAIGRAALVPASSGGALQPDLPSNQPLLTVIYANCADFAAIAQLPVDGCRDGARYQLRDPAEVGGGPRRVGLHVPVTLIGTRFSVSADRELTIPHLFYSSIPTNSLLLAADGSPDGGWPASATFVLRIKTGEQAAAAVQNRLRAIAPAATLSLQDENVSAMESYRLHKGVINLGVGLGFLLGVLAFLISSADRAMERKANIAALLVVGVPIRVLRVAQAVQLLVPLLAILGFSALVAVLAGAAYLANGGLTDSVYLGGAGPALLLVGLSTALGGLSAFALNARLPGPEYLRRD